MDSDYGGEFGAVDPVALREIRSLWHDREPLIDDSSYDDSLNPQELRVFLSDGIQADRGRFDIRWSRLDYDNFHYTEPGLDARFDRHVKPGEPERHFHEPPDAESVTESCIRQDVLPLVVLAVQKCWRRAYEAGDPALLNDLENPP